MSDDPVTKVVKLALTTCNTLPAGNLAVGNVPTYMSSSSNNNFGSFKLLAPIPLTSNLNPIVFFGEYWSTNYYLFGANLPLFTDGGNIVIS